MRLSSKLKNVVTPDPEQIANRKFDEYIRQSQKRCERYWLNDWIEEPPAENKRKALLTAALWLNQPPGQRLEQLDIFCDIVRGKFIPHNHCRDQQLLSLLLEVIDSGEPLGRH